MHVLRMNAHIQLEADARDLGTYRICANASNNRPY